jgi:hypothetical protein
VNGQIKLGHMQLELIIERKAFAPNGNVALGVMLPLGLATKERSWHLESNGPAFKKNAGALSSNGTRKDRNTLALYVYNKLIWFVV